VSQQTAFDTLAFGLGLSNEVKGTGVWSSFKLKRNNKDEKKKDTTPVKKTTDDKKKSPYGKKSSPKK
jgi:hypothetical protein